MVKFKAVRNPKPHENDCGFCVFKYDCDGTCELPKGYHYERVYIK